MNRQITQMWALALGLAIAVAAGPALAQAQGQGRGGFRGRGGFSILRLPAPVAARLNLNADQKTKIDAISDRVREELRGAFQAGGGDREALMQKIRATNEKAEAEAVAILEAGQKKQYDELKVEAMGYAALGDSATALLAIPDLNAEQKTKLKALATTAAANRPQPNAGGDRAAAAQARMARETANRTAVKAILTAGQQTQFDAAIAASTQRRRPNNQ